MAMLEEALKYAQKGLWVFPCREKPGKPYYDKEGNLIEPKEKQPYISKGFLSASVDKNVIAAWWKQWPNALIGVNCEKSELFVVDIDIKNEDGVGNFAQLGVDDSGAWHSRTASGGLHIIWSGHSITTESAIAKGVDTRGDGGYFIIPPSKIIEGDYPGEYVALDSWDVRPSKIPDILLAMLHVIEEQRNNVSAIAIDGEKRELSRSTYKFLSDGAMPGERNSALFKTLCDFAGCNYTKEEAIEKVKPVANKIGLSDSEFVQTLNHAYSKVRASAIPENYQQEMMQKVDNKRQILSTPKESPVIEEVLIGSILQDSKCLDKIRDIISSKDFYFRQHQMLWKSICNISNDGNHVNFLTLQDELRKSNNLDIYENVDKTLKGEKAIEGLVNLELLDPENLVTYANIIKNNANRRKFTDLMNTGAKLVLDGVPLAEAITKVESGIGTISISSGAKSTVVISAKEAMLQAKDRTIRASKGEIVYYNTGFADYDNYIGGIGPNELIIIAGRAGEGKSALALTIAKNMAKKDKISLFFGLEMPVYQQMNRLICQLTGIPFHRINKGKLSDKEWVEYEKAYKIVETYFINFDQTVGKISFFELKRKIKDHKAQGNLGAVFIDQLDQVEGDNSIKNEYVRIDKLTYDIKGLTVELDIPIFLNHQLNRNVTNRQYKNVEADVSDLNQAGEKAPDQVWLIIHKKDDDGNFVQSKVKVGKNRNGPKYTFPVQYIGERILFANAIRNSQVEEFVKSKEVDQEYEEELPSWARD